MKGILTIKPYSGTITYNISKEEKCYNRVKDEHLNPHYKLWERINRRLSYRGFKVTADPDTLKNYRCISKDHKYGIKKDLEFRCDRYPVGFNYEFYQNINIENRNGGKYDYDKYNQMPYLIKLSCRNELIRIGEWIKDVNVVVEYPLTDIEHIIRDSKSNTHIHGALTSLEDIAKGMKDYDFNHNSKGPNGTIIKCGELKYFYDYNNKLNRGIAYHNINNMWWVIVHGKRYNISSGNLFDYNGEPRKKPLTNEQQIQCIHSEIKKAEQSMNYKRCLDLKKHIQNQVLYNIWSLKHDCWWTGNNSGYTSDKSQAGVYTQEAITKHKDYYNNSETTIAKPVKQTA